MKYKKRPLEESFFSILVNPTSIIKISTENKEVSSLIRTAYYELLKQYDYNVSRIILDFSMPRQTFYNKLEQYGIDIKVLRKTKSKSPCVYLGLKAEVCSGLLDAQDTTLP